MTTTVIITGAKSDRFETEAVLQGASGQELSRTRVPGGEARTLHIHSENQVLVREVPKGA
jgi:hypothetical protein